MSQGLKGLVIDEPWIGKILRGEKVWEMRTTPTSVRGRIALIRKGSGQVVGSAELVDSIGPFDAIGARAHRDKHCIPSSQDDALLRWNHAWVFENVRSLIQPVDYKHPSGAVIWVRLDDAVVRQMVTDHGSSRVAGVPRPQRTSSASHPTTKPLTPPPGDPLPPTAMRVGAPVVPVAKCGSWFGPHLARRSGFTIGAKGEEKTCHDYAEALTALRAMPVPRWRRPNNQGNWGIVSGVRWCDPDDLSSGHSNELESRA